MAAFRPRCDFPPISAPAPAPSAAPPSEPMAVLCHSVLPSGFVAQPPINKTSTDKHATVFAINFMLFSFSSRTCWPAAALRQDAEKPSTPDLHSPSALPNVAEREAPVNFFDATQTVFQPQDLPA